MFGSKNKEVNNTSKKGGIMPSASPHSLNTLVKGTTVEGIIRCESDIRIDGTVKGSLDCKAKVIIGPHGLVDGDVICQNAVIEGRFEGTLKVAELLNVRETAQVNGDIKTNKLIVQSGAIFNVACKMGVQSSSSNGVTASKPSNNNGVKAGKKASEVQA